MKRGHGDGGIDARNENTWRLRYRINGQRFTKTVQGTKSEARKALRKLLHAGDTGTHVEPDKITVAQWIDHWLELGCPGKRQEKPGRRTVERYAQLLRMHVMPALGAYRLQKLTSAQIDGLYTVLAAKTIAQRTRHHVHIALGAALNAAIRAGALSTSPMVRVLTVPTRGDSDHGVALDEDQLSRLVEGFRTSPLHLFIATAAYTGMRRNEVLALRWSDFDEAGKTLKVARAIERTKAGGITFKAPKTKRGLRSVVIDDNLLRLLCAERDRHLRLIAGVPDGSQVDLRIIKIPPEALIFPSPAGGFDLAQPRDPHAVTHGFIRRARKLGFAQLRLHDLRGSHATQLLRRGMPIDVVARRLGHDPAVMMRAYAKALPSDDTKVREALAAMSHGKSSD
jgi:integrase